MEVLYYGVVVLGGGVKCICISGSDMTSPGDVDNRPSQRLPKLGSRAAHSPRAKSRGSEFPNPEVRRDEGLRATQ